MAKVTMPLKQQLEHCGRELQASRERFRSVISKSADSILILYKAGLIRFANPAARALFGRKEEELAGAPFGFPVVAGETTEVDIVSTHGQALTAEMRIVETEWEGEPAYLASLREITERKRAEEARAQLIREQVARAEAEAAQKRVASILESITDGFIALDRQWRFTYVNNAAEVLLQRSSDELNGKEIWQAFPEFAGTRLAEQYSRAMTEEVTCEFEDFYTPLGIWLETRAYPSKDGLAVYFRDISGRKRVEEIS